MVPSGSGGNERSVGCEVVCPEGDDGEEAERRRGGAKDCEIGPLALGFDAEMGAGFLEGDLELPARDEPLEDIDGSGVEIGTEEGLWLELAERIADQQPSNGQPGQAGVVPDGSAGGDLDDAIGAPYQRGTVWRCQIALASSKTWLSLGRRFPLSGGRPRPRRPSGAGA